MVQKNKVTTGRLTLTKHTHAVYTAAHNTDLQKMSSVKKSTLLKVKTEIFSNGTRYRNLEIPSPAIGVANRTEVSTVLAASKPI